MIYTIIFFIIFFYGLVYIVFNIIKMKESNKNCYTLITFKNQEDSVEAIMLSLILENKKIIAIDLGSHDDTFEILKKFQKDCKNIYVFDDIIKLKNFLEN